MTKVTCFECGTQYDKSISDNVCCPKCGSAKISLLGGIMKKNKFPVIVQDDATLTDEIMDAFDPTKGLNLQLIDPEDVDKDMMIIMLGKNDNKFGICAERFRVVKREGEKLILEPYDEKGPEAAREEIAEFIVQLHQKEIKESALSMVKKALTRKPIKRLKELKKESEKGPGAKLKTKTGCVYLVIGDEEVLL